MKELDTVRVVAPLLRRNRTAILVMVLLGFLAALSEGLGISLFIPLFYAIEPGAAEPSTGGRVVSVLNSVFEGVSPGNRLLFISAWIMVAILFKNTLLYGNRVLLHWLDARLVQRLGAQLIDRLMHASIRHIHRNDAGTFLHTFQSEIWQTSGAIWLVARAIILAATIIVFTALLFLISWEFTLVVAAALTGVSLIVRRINRRVSAHAKVGQAASEAYAQRVLEVLRGMRTIRVFGREHYERDGFEGALGRANRAYLKIDILSGLIFPLSEVVIASVLILILFVTLQDAQNLPVVITFIFILYRQFPHVQKLEEARNQLVAAYPAAERVMAYLEPATLADVPDGDIQFRSLRREIVLDDVSFRYDDDETPALSHASIRIRRGTMTALVGPSGSGKSTLINLLLRFFDPTEGTISVDGVPLTRFNRASWRGRIAVVSQDVHVFNRSVRDNIAYGRLDASPAEIVDAARAAHAHEFIVAMPEGYDTVLGDQGVRLSGGQRQRIALARAILRNPDILILDEATNALDSISENLIQQSIQNLKDERTIIVIAHRLATIEDADHVVVLQEGRVVEQGTIADLLQNAGLFVQMHQLQVRSFADAG
jgi:ATP-binding cassette, subfamily B, bacterial MsbA